MREILSLDKGWKFHPGDIETRNDYWGYVKAGTHNQTGAEKGLDDSSWPGVDVPHDFVMENDVTFHEETPKPERIAAEMSYLRDLHTLHGSRAGGVAWYRRRFTADSRGKRVLLQFDGIYRDSMIFVNNFLVDRHMSGYTGFTLDITDFLSEEGENVLAVRVDARLAEGWFYEGGGIYRHVRLITVPEISVIPHGVFVKTEVDLEAHSALIRIGTEIVNRSEEASRVEVRHTVITPDGKEIAVDGGVTEIKSGETQTAEGSVRLDDVLLWDTESPYLYRLRTELSSGDITETEFGVRDIRFDADRGFYLNGKHLKLKGVCCHHDHAGVGTALPDGLVEYRIRKLKEMGCNAYRCAHNPASEELLRACDRLGMLVMDEQRLMSSGEDELRQLAWMVRSGRNHPSVFLWCLGNEEIHIQFKKQGQNIVKTMRRQIRALDPTRPVTAAVCMWEAGRMGVTVEGTERQGMLIPGVDVFGFNYAPEVWDDFHRAYPSVPLIVTEDCSCSATRGCRRTEWKRCHLNLQDQGADGRPAGEKAWVAAADRDYIAGTFIWTGFDYHGEPSPFGWPAVSSQFGIMDLCGFPKDIYYYYKAWWSREDVLYLCRDEKSVWCMTNCDEAELWLEDRCLGRYPIEKNRILILNDFDGTGDLTAVGIKDGSERTRFTLRGFGKQESLSLKADFVCPEEDGSRTVIMNAEVFDPEGRLAENADVPVTFRYSDSVKLLGTGNGDPADHDSVKSDTRHTFNGRLQAIFSVRGEGSIRAESPGLRGAELLFPVR